MATRARVVCVLIEASEQENAAGHMMGAIHAGFGQNLGRILSKCATRNKRRLQKDGIEKFRNSYRNLPVASSSSPPITSSNSRISARILTSCSRGKARGKIGRHVVDLRQWCCAKASRLTNAVFRPRGSWDEKGKKGESRLVLGDLTGTVNAWMHREMRRKECFG